MFWTNSRNYEQQTESGKQKGTQNRWQVICAGHFEFVQVILAGVEASSLFSFSKEGAKSRISAFRCVMCKDF